MYKCTAHSLQLRTHSENLDTRAGACLPVVTACPAGAYTAGCTETVHSYTGQYTVPGFEVPGLSGIGWPRARAHPSGHPGSSAGLARLAARPSSILAGCQRAAPAVRGGGGEAWRVTHIFQSCLQSRPHAGWRRLSQRDWLLTAACLWCDAAVRAPPTAPMAIPASASSMHAY